MTSLIDVIFLLLLFFMLSSTFSKFSDVEMDVSAAADTVAAPQRSAFVRLDSDSLTLNGAPLALAALPPLLEELDAPTLLVSVRPRVDAQRLTDLLVALRRAPDVRVVLLGEG